MTATPLAVILESTVEADCPQVEVDELRESSEEIGTALRTLGYRTEVIPFTLDVASVRRQITALAPSVAFNLVDSIEGKGNLISLAPMLLAHMHIPCTGATSTATTVTCDKLITKQILRSHTIRTSDWLTEAQIVEGGAELSAPCILKSITEHASFGMFADSIVNDRATLRARWQEKKQKYGTEWFAETYIDGREFNISLLASDTPSPASVLPFAEIVFTDDFPKDKPRIIDYAAKWYEDSAESRGTVRHFDFGAQDAALLASIKDIALTCWNSFGLTGYARVDFRVDKTGTPYVLEVNSNPFLGSDAGFMAAAARAGMTFNDAIRAIVMDAYRRGTHPVPETLAA